MGKRKPSDDAIIDQIEAIRRENNRRWMDLVRLAFRTAPRDARRIMREIVDGDAAVAEQARKLSED